jgi:hypothetical protein
LGFPELQGAVHVVLPSFENRIETDRIGRNGVVSFFVEGSDALVKLLSPIRRLGTSQGVQIEIK